MKRLVLEGDDRRSLDNTVVTCRNTHTGRAAPIKKYFWIDFSGKILNLLNMALKIKKNKISVLKTDDSHVKQTERAVKVCDKRYWVSRSGF